MVDKYIKKIKTSSPDNKSSKGRIYKTGKDDRGLKNSYPLKKRFQAKPKITKERFSLLPTYNKVLPKTLEPLDFKHFFKSQFKANLKKNNNLSLCRKVFTKKMDLNKVQGRAAFNRLGESKGLSVVGYPNTLQVKSSIYLLLKTLKNLKKITLGPSIEENSVSELDQFCLRLEKSGFYLSLVELEKKRNLSLLKLKTKKIVCNSFFQPFRLKHKQYVGKNFQTANGLISIKSPYQRLQKKSRKVKIKSAKKNTHGVIIRKGFVHLKKNYSYITESRISLYMATYKKKYTKLFRIMKKNKRKFRRLFFDFQIKQLRHTSRLKRRYKLYRSLAWKRKKKKIRKKVGLFYFLRMRPHMLFRFYIPRHLEINYKTFDVAHLGELDLTSVNPRISLWLNLRRLLTSLAI